MSHRVGNGALLTGAHVVSSNGGLGILAESIPTTSYIYPSLDLPTDNGKEIRGEITSGPTVTSGTGTISSFFAYEDGDYDLTTTGDCTVQWTWSLYVDGALDTAGLTATVGIGSVAFTAVNVESASEVSSPTVGQNYSFTAVSVESTTETSAPALGQTHAFTAVSVESASETNSPTVGQNHSFTATSVESASEISSPALGVTYSFTAVGVESASKVSTPYVIPRPAGYKITFFTVDFAGLDANSPLSGDPAYSALVAGDAILYEGTSPESGVDWVFTDTGVLDPTPDSFGVDQTCDFQIWDASDETIGNAGTITVLATATQFVPVNAESASEVGAPALGQNYSFTPVGAESASEVSTPALSTVYNFTAVDAESLTEVGNPLLSVGTNYSFTAINAESLTQVGNPILGQNHVFAGTSVEAVSEVSSPSLSGSPVTLEDLQTQLTSIESKLDALTTASIADAVANTDWPSIFWGDQSIMDMLIVQRLRQEGDVSTILASLGQVAQDVLDNKTEIDKIKVRLDLDRANQNKYSNDGSVITNNLYTWSKSDNGDGTFDVIETDT